MRGEVIKLCVKLIAILISTTFFLSKRGIGVSVNFGSRLLGE